jgi:hypothetical protein
MNIQLSNSWATLRDVISTVFERKEITNIKKIERE